MEWPDADLELRIKKIAALWPGDVQSLSLELGLSKSAISNWINKVAHPRVGNLVQMCKLVGLDEPKWWAWVLFGVGEEPRGKPRLVFEHDAAPAGAPSPQTEGHAQQSGAIEKVPALGGATPSMNATQQSGAQQPGASPAAKNAKSPGAGRHKPAGAPAPSNRTSRGKQDRKR